MLTTVDRVIAKLTLKHPAPDAPSAVACNDASQFAAKLLENYMGELARRHLADQPSRSSAS